jgi:hypothetical protein
MNTVKCPGCSQPFDQGVAIKAHQRSCTGLRLVDQKQIKRRLENAQKREAVKLTRIEGQSMDNIERRRELREDFNDNITHDPTVVPSPDNRSGPSAVSITTLSLSRRADNTD